MKHGLRRGEYVLVHWRDATGGNSWVTEKSFTREALQRSKMRTIGRLVRITNEYIIMAAGINREGLLQRPGFIPLSLVSSIERVTPVRMKRKTKKP